MAKKASNTQAKPPRAAREPEAHVDDRAGLPPDTGAANPDTNTLRGSSGTAREASSTDGGTTAETPSVGTQSGSPNTPPGDPASPHLSPPFFVSEQRYPLLFAKADAWDVLPTAVRISARADGFRRAGMAHRATAVDHPVEGFSQAQLEQLLGEPNLTVEFV